MSTEDYFNEVEGLIRLTPEKLEEFKEAFALFDKNGDGTIDSHELVAVMRMMGYNPTDEEIQEMIDDADKDMSGSINFQEFIGLMRKKKSFEMTVEDIRQIFRVFDKDGNGFISTAEIKHVTSRLYMQFSNDELNEMVYEADLDGNGQIGFDEFYSIMITP
ncbi:neo-calmodulin [Lepeophtheirus salmonis]|uniref:Calmodulinlike 3 [Dasypus novemcinctus] n=1 Tax=Lepeophtheirus salmonis TaxID=72036 RepID=A0A0K2V950_LEPSM|nr:calmodulin-A-like [Lepeophtheirus salmonis]